MKFLSWNINGVRMKLENSTVHKLLVQYDIISLNEVKNNSRLSFPGYISYASAMSDGGHRGGTVVMVSRRLQVEYVDVSTVDQVWLRLASIPRVIFGFCYVPPADSPYFNPILFSAIQEKVKAVKEDTSIVLFGDLNARFGAAVQELPARAEIPDAIHYTYPRIPDPVAAPNDNAIAMAALCVSEGLVVVNNLKTPDKYFPSNLTYRKAAHWISELDTCIVSPQLLNYIDDFKVTQSMSLPSDHAPISLSVRPLCVDIMSLWEKAHMLGGHAALHNRSKEGSLVRRAIKSNEFCKSRFLEVLSQREVPQPEPGADINDYAEAISNTLYGCADASRCEERGPRCDMNMSRWDRLMDDPNDDRIWRAIDWQGQYSDAKQPDCRPSDQDFKVFYEELLNPPGEGTLIDCQTQIYIPVLDDEIEVEEVSSQVRRLKVDKASGPDGICPGVVKILPVQWIVTLATLFNAVFHSGSYPSSWCIAKLVSLFKRGNKALPRNYRGINILNCIAKLYDMVLCARLQQWFVPYKEQAGSQPGRSCLEHIITLRLLIDVANRKNFKLYVCFIDFSQAYDRVPRRKLLDVLVRLGCGAIMVAAIVAMYRTTHSVIGTAIVTAMVGVRQGSPSSCLLFILYVNDLIKLIKENCGPDGFLSWLHVLMLMDDTVLLSTTRNGMTAKLSLLSQYCDEYGMLINEGKTKFFVINGREADRMPFLMGELSVAWCSQYVYLGSIFTSDGSVSSAIAAHAQAKMCHILKFVSFIKKNNEVPFYVKRKLFEAALMSSVLYGCES